MGEKRTLPKSSECRLLTDSVEKAEVWPTAEFCDAAVEL
jgi:hypothetical protein